MWAKQAVDDLESIVSFIKKVSEDILNKVELLPKFPNVGRVVPEMNEKGIREISIYSYRIIYSFDKVITVLAIVHKKRILTFREKK